MTALYCYMIVYYCYSDSEHLPLFHEKKYTRQEFQEICNKIFNEIKDNENNKYTWEYTNTFMEYAEKYGFKNINILECDTTNGKVTTYGQLETCVTCKYSLIDNGTYCNRETLKKVKSSFVCEYYEKKGII